MLGKFFLKYVGKGEGGSQIEPSPPQEELPSKSSALLGLT